MKFVFKSPNILPEIRRHPRLPFSGTLEMMENTNYKQIKKIIDGDLNGCFDISCSPLVRIHQCWSGGRQGGREVSLQIGAGKPGVHTLLLTIIYLFTVKLNNKLNSRPVKIINNAHTKYQILNILNKHHRNYTIISR